MLLTIAIHVALASLALFYLMIFLDASASPGTHLCRYLRKLASASLATTQNDTHLQIATARSGAGLTASSQESTMTVEEHDITVVTPAGLRVGVQRRPLGLQIEGQPLPTSFLDGIAIAWTFHYLKRARRRAERIVFAEIVNGL